MRFSNGRFRKGLHPEALNFSSSLRFDQRLYREDIEGSLAHAAMLAKQGIISGKDARKIHKALQEIRKEIETGRIVLNEGAKTSKRFVGDDIHMAIEQRLIKKIGAVGGKLHTARSRNDQVALDERLYLRNTIHAIDGLIRRLQKAFVAKAEKNQSVIMPGYTHLQRAQPILLAHHLLAYVSMLERDHERFHDCFIRVNRSPLGAAALAGTSFPIDRVFVARKLGFRDLIENSIDAVSDRDVQIEFLAACAIAMMHLSRFAEELVLWSSQEWNFAEIGDAFTTGSSIMPHKKNPDVAELVRGKAGKVYGNLVALLTVMKGLPLTYNRDMQEDKEPLFNSADTLADCLRISSLMLESVTFRAERFQEDLSSDFLAATDIAEYLTRRGMPFRQAHAVAGKIVRYCLAKHISLKNLPLKDLRRFSQVFDADVLRIFDPKVSILQKKSRGSTSPREVQKAIRFWKKKLK